MKKRFLFLALLTLSIINFAYAENDDEYIFQVNREGGKIVTTHSGFLGLVHHQYVGFLKVEYRTEGKVVHVNCDGEGVNRCRVTTPDGKSHTFSVGKNTFYFGTFEELFDRMLLNVEDMIYDNSYRGSLTQKVSSVSVEGNRVNIAFKIVWDLDKEGNGCISMIANEFSTL
ncbi:MAG: hypothetical protein IJR03_01960 [Bacteroidales bacterium]|jgi:hypothetical protein|nr:hypothetical protein [Bacteroidales bacterium]